MQRRLRYPILDDDIKAITLGHIRDMRPVPEPKIQSLAECFPKLRNPRLRFIAFGILRHSHPDFLKLCRKLLDDEHLGIRLEAAIALAENGLVSDPGEPRLFPILLAALESKKERDACVEIASYTYRQQPPGSPRPFPLPPGFPVSPVTPEQYLRTRIEAALYRLERHLPQEQKDRFRQAIKDQKP